MLPTAMAFTSTAARAPFPLTPIWLEITGSTWSSVHSSASAERRGPQGTELHTIQSVFESRKKWIYQKTNHPQKYGDGHSDLVWFNQTTNQVGVWLMNGNSIIANPILGKAPANRRIVAVGNLNRTGNPQIVWYTGSNTYIAWSITWSGSQPTTTATSFSLPTNSPTLAIADFDGDGLQDVVQWDASSSKLSIAKNNGSLNFTQQYSTVVATGWDLVGVADLNGDGRHELVWRNHITGQVSAWVMNKFQPAQYPAYSSPSLSWRIRGIGKVDASNAQGLVWRNEQTGQTSFWKLNTNGQVTDLSLPVGAAPWEIAGAPYFDGRNGLPEILWYNTQTGAVTIWRVNGTSITSSVIAVPSTQWTIQPAVIGD